jgi:hypothetical protein
MPVSSRNALRRWRIRSASSSSAVLGALLPLQFALAALGLRLTGALR